MYCNISTTDENVFRRFWIIGVFGTTVAIFGVFANAILATLFLIRHIYRHSPLFFLGFVAFYDTLVDLSYILLLSLPTIANHSNNFAFYNWWETYIRQIYPLEQFFRISSVFCLVVASFERFYITRHWTFAGFQYRTRWIIHFFIILFAVLFKTINFSDFSRLTVGKCNKFELTEMNGQGRNFFFSQLVNIASIFIPFITLVLLNGAIVMMLRKQHVQQLRSLITEFTMGTDVMKLRRRNLRAATNTLIIIISAYIISNLLNLVLVIMEFFWPDYIRRNNGTYKSIASDISSVLTVVGNAIRFPAHLISNKDMRRYFFRFFSQSTENQTVIRFRQRSCQKVDAPWISLLIVPEDVTNDDQKSSISSRWHNFELIHLANSAKENLIGFTRRNTYCTDNNNEINGRKHLAECEKRLFSSLCEQEHCA